MGGWRRAWEELARGVVDGGGGVAEVGEDFGEVGFGFGFFAVPHEEVR